jgi:hypothetical protein
MINSLEEAQTHVQNNAFKVSNGFKYVVVLNTGHIITDNDEESMQSIVNESECFVVKGELSKQEVKQETKNEIE